jgi:predicted NAD/FAD-dependent oxidoreductase
MKQIRSVAVIGAGIAGLACASTLQAAGLEVKVFEKSRGVGGRMSTRRADGWQCDHGAQYFTASDPAFIDEVQRWLVAGAAAPWPMRLASIGPQRTITMCNGSGRYVGTPRMTSPAAFLAESLSIRLHTTVNTIERRDGLWHLSSLEHGALGHGVDGLVLAAPAPQTAHLARGRGMSFEARIAHATMLPCWAVMAQTNDTDPGFDAAFIEGSPLSWIACNNSKPRRDGQRTWLLHASAPWSQRHLEEPEEIVISELAAVFREITGLSILTRTAHRWRYALGDASLTEGFLFDPDLQVGACGDWAHSNRVQGAWLSGRLLAREILG